MSETVTTPETHPTESPQPQLAEERIRIRAYELYEKRHGQAGDAMSDWYQAVAELESEAGEVVK